MFAFPPQKRGYFVNVYKFLHAGRCVCPRVRVCVCVYNTSIKILKTPPFLSRRSPPPPPPPLIHAGRRKKERKTETVESYCYSPSYPCFLARIRGRDLSTSWNKSSRFTTGRGRESSVERSDDRVKRSNGTE